VSSTTTSGGARTAAGAHRGPDVSDKPGPTRESGGDDLLRTQQNPCRSIGRTNRDIGHQVSANGGKHIQDYVLHRCRQPTSGHQYAPSLARTALSVLAISRRSLAIDQLST